MNICYMLNYPGSGGAEKYCKYLAEQAISDGNKVTFIFGEDGPFVRIVENLNIRYQIIKMPNVWSVVSALQINKFLKVNNIDIVHSNFLREHSLSVLARVFGSKAKVVRSVLRADKFSSSVFLYMKILNIFTGVIVVAPKFIKDILEKKGLGKNVVIIPNGVSKTKVSVHENNIGYLGRVDKEKGIVDLSREASKVLKRTKLIIAGDGPDINELKNEKGIKLLGRIENLEYFFSKIAVLVNPSPTEVMPLSYLEAFSAGIPVVCFNIPANKEIVNERNGKIVKFGDFTKLLEEAEDIMNNPKMLNELSIQAKNDYEKKYSVEIMWENTKAVYESLV